jgi:hypothetical protein
VLILTTFDADEYVHEAMKAGASGFLLKDVRPEQLADAAPVVARNGDTLLVPAITRRLVQQSVHRPPPGPVPAPTPSRRAAPRAQLTLPVTLKRVKGNPIASRTQDVSSGGMRVTTSRPLAVDEVLHFELPLDVDTHVEGQARVMREHPFGAYALRFERLSLQGAERLSQLVDSAIR